MPNENAIVFTTQTQFQQLDCATCATITITNVTITYSIKFTLPKWSNYDNATPQDQALWDSFYARVVEHENGHAAIIDDFMKALANRLMGLSATCCDENQQGALTRANAALNEAINSTKTAIGDELQAANDKYHEKVGTVIPCFQENDND
jgi:predicted secreted Zn-dependent protease